MIPGGGFGLCCFRGAWFWGPVVLLFEVWFLPFLRWFSFPLFCCAPLLRLWFSFLVWACPASFVGLLLWEICDIESKFLRSRDVGIRIPLSDSFYYLVMVIWGFEFKDYYGFRLSFGVSASSVLIQRYGINAWSILTSRTEVDWESGVVIQMWSKGLFRFRL